jgi:hypothetical protein
MQSFIKNAKFQIHLAFEMLGAFLKHLNNLKKLQLNNVTKCPEKVYEISLPNTTKRATPAPWCLLIPETKRSLLT